MNFITEWKMKSSILNLIVVIVSGKKRRNLKSTTEIGGKRLSLVKKIVEKKMYPRRTKTKMYRL
jgi:hypothetical protein